MTVASVTDIAALKADRNARELQERRWSLYLGYFLWCKKDPGMFFRDPLVIDRFLARLAEYCTSFTPREWPGLYDIRARIEKIARETRDLRLRMTVVRTFTAPAGAPN